MTEQDKQKIAKFFEPEHVLVIQTTRDGTWQFHKNGLDTSRILPREDDQ